MMKSQITLILEVLGLVVISAAADDLDDPLGRVREAPLRKRNQLRHWSSRHARATEIQGEEGERFDPFMGIKRDLRFDSSLSSMSSLSFSNPTYMAPLSLSFSMATNTNEEGGEMLSDGYMLQHKLNEADGTITMELVYDGDAWIGIAFSDDDKMAGSDAVM